jgi:hypothetical protein
MINAQDEHSPRLQAHLVLESVQAHLVLETSLRFRLISY